MATEKDNQFVQYLLDATDTGKIKWEPAAEPDRFVSSFKGKYSIMVDKSEPRDEAPFYYIKLTDEADQELLTVDAEENPRVKALFYLARRRSLNVDSAIDEIMGSAPGPSPITEDDIPF
jgi:hypothetical protein